MKRTVYGDDHEAYRDSVRQFLVRYFEPRAEHIRR